MNIDTSAITKAIQKLEKESVEKANKLKRAIGIELFNKIIMDTPVDTGRLAGNWQTSTAKPKGGELDTAGASEAITEAITVTSKSKFDDDLYLANNLPYAAVIEYEGHSKKAPDGMVRRNIAKSASIVNKHLNKIK